CRGVAVLPEGMSAERFAWLERWVTHAEDIIRTPGTESNVREIYAECEVLAKDPANQILNQFSQFENHLAHRAVTGPALSRCFERVARGRPGMTLAAFVSATGSAGTIAAGDYLKDVFGSRTVAVEALECPTLLRNGYGAHNIQGIGDKHVPLIHNVMRTDLVVGVSDQATDHLDAVFQTEVGRAYLASRRRVPEAIIAALGDFGLSAICNVLAAIKTARYLGLGPDEAVITVATDGADLYPSDRRALFARQYAEGFDAIDAAEAFGRYMLGAEGHVLELSEVDRHRIFNLGYFTWVEQLGVPLEDFEARRSQRFWRELVASLPELDARIAEMDAEVARA
ncbi:MAG TPA: pyridoxal-5'-phosphate-dependent protein subunit beta, partial [Myxococcota bacterium]|nr:pyridoxal-5'-phosphate-dependent protein subunit beta [Myxococcota bacterium]